jgi:spore germination cell wall hydrolase CwlJ-like protein
VELKFSDMLAISTIVQEASNQGYEGMLGVAEVIVRRTRLKVMSDGTLADTLLRPYQFSGWNTNDPNRVRAAKHLDRMTPAASTARRAWAHANGALDQGELGPPKAPTDTTNGATHYFNPKAVQSVPFWAKGKTPCANIFDHLFFKDI